LRNERQNFPAAAAFIVLLLACPCLAQTPAQTSTPGQSVLAPSRIAPPPAIQGAYENQPVRASGATSSANLKQDASSSLSTTPVDFRRVAISLGIVLALVFLCRWAARYFFPSASVGRSSQVMKVVSRSVIAPKQQLLLIQVGKRLVLVGDCGQQMNALAEISDPDEVAGLLGQLQSTEAPANNRFAPLFGRAQRDFEDVPSAADPDEDEPELAVADGADETRNELSGLTDKIRMLSRQLGKT
jgi:flagellar protein FliO/FliZ